MFNFMHGVSVEKQIWHTQVHTCTHAGCSGCPIVMGSLYITQWGCKWLITVRLQVTGYTVPQVTFTDALCTKDKGYIYCMYITIIYIRCLTVDMNKVREGTLTCSWSAYIQQFTLACNPVCCNVYIYISRIAAPVGMNCVGSNNWLG